MPKKRDRKNSRILEQWILRKLGKHGAVLTDGHYVYTSDKHGPAYINMRLAAHDWRFMHRVGNELGRRIAQYKPDVIVGPETLGRTLVDYAANKSRSAEAVVWCRFVGDGQGKMAMWPDNLGHFGNVVRGKRIAIVDDLLTTGSSIRQVTELIENLGGEVVVVAVVARRSQDVTAEACGAPVLVVLADVKGFTEYSPETCPLCHDQVPVVLRPGHGHSWILKPENRGYPVAE